MARPMPDRLPLAGCPDKDRAPSSRSSQEIPVASVCDVCGKGPGFGHNVPWSKKKTNRRWDPNIQSVRVSAGGGNTKRLQVCTSCIKAGKVARASRA